MSFSRLAGPYVHLLRMLVIGLLTLSISRVLLIFWQFDRVAPTHELFNILLQGVRADLILMCMGAILPTALALVWGHKKLARSWFTFTYWW